MKLKDGAEKQWSEDAYYDLFDGGYLDPEKFLDNEEDIEKVREAILLIEDYLNLVVIGEDDEDNNDDEEDEPENEWK